jgi:hypothetical protein
MRNLFHLAVILVVLLMGFLTPAWPAGGGITPEQIFLQVIDWQQVVGTWEILPEDSPLHEKNEGSTKPAVRTLMTLRKDGTCRIFNKEFPAGSDALWTFDDHQMFVTFPNGKRQEFYVYGVRSDFMVTRSPIKQGIDQLWSRVK